MIIASIIVTLFGIGWYRFSIEKQSIIIRWLGKYHYKTIPIKDITEMYIFSGPHDGSSDGRDLCGAGFMFLWRALKLRYLPYMKGSKLSHITITPDNSCIFVKQIDSIRNDNSITGYLLPDCKVRNILLISFFVINSIVCLMLINYTANSHFIFTGIYVLISFIINNIIRFQANKYMYKDYFNNLEKYVIRD